MSIPADGTYSFNRVQAYGPSTPILTRIAGGQLAEYVIGRGDAAQTCPAHLLPGIVAHVLAEVAARQQYSKHFGAPLAFVPAPAPTLTRQRARAMHRELARLGIPTDRRYQLAAQVTGLPVVESLTALTEPQARAVWQAAKQPAA